MIFNSIVSCFLFLLKRKEVKTMDKVKGLVNSAEKFCTDNAPVILTVLGASGLFISVGFAFNAGTKASKILVNAEREKGEKLTKKEVVQHTWKIFIPTAVSTISSAACIIGANSVNAKRNAALATAYKITETALIEYRDAVEETIGKKKAIAVQDKVAENHIKDHPVTETLIFPGEGDYMCYDSISGRYFKSNKEKIDRAINTLNAEMFSNMYISLNEYFVELGLTATQLGNELGWAVPNILETHYSYVSTEDGKPCISIEHYNMPGPRFSYGDMP